MSESDMQTLMDSSPKRSTFLAAAVMAVQHSFVLFRRIPYLWRDNERDPSVATFLIRHISHPETLSC